MQSELTLGPGAIFTLLFITLGPLKLLGPFAQRTNELDEKALRAVSIRVFLVSLIAVVIGGFLGRALLISWNISVPALLIATGIIFFLVALKLVLQQYEPEHAVEPPPLPAAPMAAAMKLAFPLVVTPYGIAALIALLATVRDEARVEVILGLLLGVMVLNLLAMIYCRRVMHGVTVLALQLLGAILGVMQVALAVQIVIRGLRGLGALT